MYTIFVFVVENSRAASKKLHFLISPENQVLTSNVAQWNCDDFDTSGERLVGEFERDGTDDKHDERLDTKLDGDEHSNSSRLLFDGLSLSLTSLMMIILVIGGGEVISMSSSELPSDALMLLLSSFDIRNVNLFLPNRFLRFRHGRVSGNGGWLQDFG